MFKTIDRRAASSNIKNTEYAEYSRIKFDNVSAALKEIAKADDYDLSHDKKLVSNVELLKQLTNSSDVHVHFIDENNRRILVDIKDVYISTDDELERPGHIEKDHIAESIARLKEPVIVDSLSSLDNIFPQGVQISNEYATNMVCIPIMSTKKENRCYMVIEFIRENSKPYSQVDIKLINSATKWLALSMEQKEIKSSEQRNFKLNVKLRGFVEQYFLETVTYEEFLSNILIFTQNLIGASRSFFYRITTRLNSVINHADLFEDVMIGNEHKIVKLPQPIKLSREKGIASKVIKTGEPIIFSASEDHNLRLDAEMMKIMQVSLETCLCKPLIYNDVAIAVIQFMNKKNEELFTPTDLVVVDRVCVYLSLVQHFEKIRELCDFEYAKCEIIRDQLGFHLTNLATVPVYMKLTAEDLPEGFEEYTWYAEGKEDMAIPYCFYLFKAVCPDVVNEDALYEFIVNVKKCCRPLPYRNFMHTLDVMHTLYCLFKDIREKLNKIEIYALMLVAACQSVNSEGCDSQYYLVTDNPYTRVYEHPHFRNFQSSFSKRLIETHNVLDHFNEDEQNKIYKIFNDCLINLNTMHGAVSVGKLIKFVQEKKIVEVNPQHRLYKLNLIMRAVCKARVCKPFRVAKGLCEEIYRELFAEGDLLKAAHKSLKPWMDRTNVHMIPEYEVQYIRRICLPIYDMLKLIYPAAGTLYSLCKELEKAWTLVIELQYKKAWNPDESIGKSLEETTKQTFV